MQSEAFRDPVPNVNVPTGQVVQETSSAISLYFPKGQSLHPGLSGSELSRKVPGPQGTKLNEQ